MSIDIDWESLTTGPEGLALAETVRVFIDEKFQQVHFPGFIRSVHVHSFDFGQECPLVELKDISDPLSEFYENDDDLSDDDEVDDGEPTAESLRFPQANGSIHNTPQAANRPPDIDTHIPGPRLFGSLADPAASPFHSRASTPGILGGTSNLSYFHLPLSAGISGSQTPLAAVAGGSSFASWPDQQYPASAGFSQPRSPSRQPPSSTDPISRPSPLEPYRRAPPSIVQSPLRADDSAPSADGKQTSSPSAPSPLDTQVTMHITYTGSVSLSITASLLLDYPMSSFASIPLKLSITGFSFDGVALLAYLRKKAHFCFLGAEDAQILVGAEGKSQEGDGTSEIVGRTNNGKDRLGGLIREIRVESEIGKREGGKQSLKNVGKVERFVVEQVRRIFEEEFVWPSWWTFLV